MPRKKKTETKKKTKKAVDKKNKEKIVKTFIKEAKKELVDLRKKKNRDKKLDDNAEQFAQELDTFLAKATKTKVESLSERDDVPFWLDTNCMALNWIISNDFNKGIPGTRAVVISGKSGKGKSLLLDNILGENIRNGGVSYKLDIEDAGTEKFTAKIVSSDKVASRIRTIGPKDLQKKTAMKDQVITIEKLTKIINKIIDYQASKGKDKQKSVVLGVDSVTQLTSEKEYEKVVKEKEAKDMTAAQKMRELFRTLTQKFKTTNITMIGLAQLTANIGVTFGKRDVENVKGTGYIYASSLNLQMTSDKPLTTSIKGGAEIPVGIKMRMKTTKNRIEFRGRDAWLYFYFDSGIDRYGGLPELLAQYGVFKASSKANVIGEYSDSTTFKWVHPDTKKEYSFKLRNFTNFIEELDKKEIDELVEIWNLQLNLVWEKITENMDEAELLGDDGPEDEEFFNEIEDE